MEKNHQRKNGYTILEALIAVSLFLLIVVPLTSRLVRLGQTNTERQRITASCILEQEAATISADPNSATPEKRRKIQGREWIIRTEQEGNRLRFYRVNAFIGKKKFGEIGFYVHNQN